MINDSDIITYIEKNGPATIGQINRQLIDRYPGITPNRIYHDVSIKARKLVKYRHLKAIQYPGVTYYALPDMDIPEGSRYEIPAPYMIRAYIDDLPDGATLTYDDITARFGVSTRTAYKYVKRSPNLKKAPQKRALFVKGA